MGSKRGRFLIRQPRIKKDIELGDHQSSEFEEPMYTTGLLTVPPKIERHSSEPAPTIALSPHLLALPQPTYLVKQHSHPLLPSQSPTSNTLTLQRQLSHPLTQSSSSICSSAPCFTSQLSVDNTLSIAQFTSTIKSEDMMGVVSKSSSPSVVIVTDPMSVSVDLPTIRVKSEELQRSISTPQTITRELSIENARSSHCPVVRPGPALGCNFCWNTIDAHGRILRRKTKYHCPECQTNLCIVPCFQEFHERQSNENTGGSSGGGNSSGSGGNLLSENNKSSTPSLRQYSKTGSL